MLLNIVLIPADKTFEFWCVNSRQHWLSLHVFKSDKLYQYHGMINFGFFNDVLHDIWTGNVLGWRTHQRGGGQGNLFKTNWRPTINSSVFYSYFTQIWVLYECGWKPLIFKTKKVQTLQWGGAQQRGKVIRVLTATTIRTPIVGVFKEWK